MSDTDVIEHPAHYLAENVTITIEPIELCEQCGFLFGNALKYLFRYEHKGKPLEDLKKARFYLNRWLEQSTDGSELIDLNIFSVRDREFKAFSQKEFLQAWKDFKPDSANVRQILLLVEQRIQELEKQK